MSSTTAAAPAHARSAIAYNLAGLTVLVLLLAVALAYLIDRTGHSGGQAEPRLGDGHPITQTVGGRELSIPENWFRYGEQMKGGFASQVDLQLQLNLQSGARPSSVDVSLMPASKARTSSTLLDRVYLHQFGPGTKSGHPGLVGKPMQPREGYVGETVWYDALSPNPFVAKCADAVTVGQPATCLRTIHLPSGIAAVLKFDETALDNWQRFDDELALWLGQIGAL